MQWPSQHEGDAEEQSAADPTSETSSEPTEASPSESTTVFQEQSSSSPSEPTDESSDPSSETTPDTSPSASETSSSEPPDSPQGGHPLESEGVLLGTGSEQEPGVGGTADHPAPAVMRDPQSGEIHSAGQPPAGNVAPEASPIGDTVDQPDEGHSLTPEAEEALHAEQEPEQVETERPDIGTE